MKQAIAKAEEELGETGRVLLRPSGTEELFRVMVEAADSATARKIAGQLAAVVAEVQPGADSGVRGSPTDFGFSGTFRPLALSNRVEGFAAVPATTGRHRARCAKGRGGRV